LDGDVDPPRSSRPPDLTIEPGTEEASVALTVLAETDLSGDRRPPTALVPAPDMGMSDAPFASVSILNEASLRALSQKIGKPLDPRRFRGNLWLEGLAPWEEFDLVGKRLRVGEAELDIVEPIGRCRATEANPDTGRRDVSTLAALEDGWGHTQFGVYAMVRKGGRVSVGDTASLI
jgi:uncharacterized protein YcbX